MQVQSKKTLNLNDLLGTKAQGGEAEVSSTQDGEMFFSELLGDAVDEGENVTGPENENQEEVLVKLETAEVNDSEKVDSLKNNIQTTEINKILNSKNSDNPKNNEIETQTQTQTPLTKVADKLQSIFNKKSENNFEGIENSEVELTAHKDIKTSKKNFLNEILGKVTKASGEEKQMASSSNKASELRINTEVNPELMKAELTKKNNAGMNLYKKEISSLNESLVRSPVHGQLIENQKLLDENGFSKIHKSENVEYSPASNIEAVQSIELNNGSENQKENFSSEKVLDLSQIKAESKTALIKQVSNYIEQSYVSNQETVDLVVKHDELGSFRIIAQKSGPGNQVNLEINTVTKQAEAFFMENESELIKNLNSGGVKLSSVKVVAKPEFLFTMEGGKTGNMEQSLNSGREQSFHGRGEQRNQSSSQNFSGGRERREALWQQAQEFNKYAA